MVEMTPYHLRRELAKNDMDEINEKRRVVREALENKKRELIEK